MLPLMGGQLVTASCHSNVLYDTAVHQTQRAIIWGTCWRRCAYLLNTVAAFSLMSVNVSARTEVTVSLQRDTLSKGSCKGRHHERQHHDCSYFIPVHLFILVFLYTERVPTPCSSSIAARQSLRCPRFNSSQVYCWWIIHTSQVHY